MGTFSNIKDAHKELEKKLNDIGRAVFIEVSNTVIADSPVDTGRFRGNWQASINYPITNTLDLESSKNRIEDVNAKVGTMNLRDVGYLTNNLPYAEPLEYGHSQQRGEGWVRTIVANGQQLLGQKVRELA